MATPQSRAAKPPGKRRARRPGPVEITTEITYLSGPGTDRFADEQLSIIKEVLAWARQQQTPPSPGS